MNRVTDYLLRFHATKNLIYVRTERLLSVELKTEEGYSADIVRTYIPGDICPHNVGTMSAQHLTKDICLTREMLCGHSADIVPIL